MSGSHRHVVIGVYWLCRLFHDVPATSARFSHLDPRDRSHAPPCQCPPKRVPPRAGACVVARGGRSFYRPGQQRPGGTLVPHRLAANVLVPAPSQAMSGSLFLMMLPRTVLPVATVPPSPVNTPTPACCSAGTPAGPVLPVTMLPRTFTSWAPDSPIPIPPMLPPPSSAGISHSLLLFFTLLPRMSAAPAGPGASA